VNTDAEPRPHVVTGATLLDVRLRSGCIEWLDRDAAAPDPLPSCFGEPGLWRWQRTAGEPERVFALPPLPPGLAALASDEFAADYDYDAEVADAPTAIDIDPRSASSVCSWVEATSRGRLPRDWRAPEPAEAASWLAAGRLSLRAGGRLAKAELDCRSDRLRVLCAEVARPPAQLDPARQAWLHAVCDEAQQRWLLVRMAFADGVVRAEVDLSGVPAPLAEPLVVLAFESLARAVVSTLGALRLLCDPDTKSHLLSSPPRFEERGKDRRDE
jgi:hypothetical protein